MALKWRWWRWKNRATIANYSSTSVQPNLQFLHKILERVDSNTFQYLLEQGDYLKTFNTNHSNILILTQELKRRNREIETRSHLKFEMTMIGKITIRDFFIDQDKTYISYVDGYINLRKSALEVIANINEILDVTHETFLENHYSRRTAKMLLSVERLLMAICQ